MLNAVDYFRKLIADNKSGRGCSICSVCSANNLVIEAALEEGLKLGKPVLVEATANQINQFGGYTGKRPADFADYIKGIARKVGFDEDMLILGGDHLGPLVWQSDNEDEAMSKSEELVRQFAAAGFQKIHLDCSMMVASDDHDLPLPVETVAKRAARLCKVAEEASPIKPVYIVGSEVPIPGGATEVEEGLQVTKSSDLLNQISAFRKAFEENGLSDAWTRVIAVVVQPGVEFGDAQVFLYDHDAAEDLINTAHAIDGIALEGHSTDYQPKKCLADMAKDGIAILKVGPALTFELRNALFALEEIEKVQYADKAPEGGLSRFADTLEEEMLANPSNWIKHYHGDDHQLMVQRKYSLSDRCRYYLDSDKVQESIGRLFKNVDAAELPYGLIWQYMPRQAENVIAGKLDAEAAALAKEAVCCCLRTYEN